MIWGNIFSVKRPWVVNQVRVESIVSVEKWQTVRKYNKSHVPSCAWDVGRDLVCVARDTNGFCTDYDYEYDYSLREWGDYNKYDTVTFFENHDVIKVITAWYPRDVTYRVKKEKYIMDYSLSRLHDDKTKTQRIVYKYNPKNVIPYAIGDTVYIRQAWGKLK